MNLIEFETERFGKFWEGDRDLNINQQSYEYHDLSNLDLELEEEQRFNRIERDFEMYFEPSRRYHFYRI